MLQFQFAESHDIPRSSEPTYFVAPIWCQKNVHFTGRKAALKLVREKLCNEKYSHRLALHGLGGVGKTQLAIEYVFSFKHEYNGMYWITAVDKNEILSGFRAIALATGCVRTDDVSLDDIAKAVLQWLRKQDKWLLVLDNLDDISAVTGNLPDTSNKEIG